MFGIVALGRAAEDIDLLFEDAKRTASWMHKEVSTHLITGVCEPLAQEQERGVHGPSRQDHLVCLDLKRRILARLRVYNLPGHSDGALVLNLNLVHPRIGKDSHVGLERAWQPVDVRRRLAIGWAAGLTRATTHAARGVSRHIVVLDARHLGKPTAR